MGPTAPTRINDRGQIVGLYSDNAPNTKDPDAIVHGFVLDRRKVTTIDTAAGSWASRATL